MGSSLLDRLKKIDFKSVLAPPKPKVGTKGTNTGTTKIDYVTEFASIKCSQSSHFLKLQLPIPIGQRAKYGEGPLKHRGAMVTDCIPEINYPLFLAPWNLCFSLANPQVLALTTAKFATTGTWTIVPVPCCLGHLPIGIWGKSVGNHKYSYVPHTGFASLLSFRNLALFFNKDPKVDALTKNCTLTCAWMGTISIVSSGRDEMDPSPYNPVTGLIGPSAFDCLRNACGIIMNYTGLGASMAIAALDSVAAGLKEGFENGFEEGLRAGLRTAFNYGVGFAIGGGLAKGGKMIGKKTGFKVGTWVSTKFGPQAQSKLAKAIQKLEYTRFFTKGKIFVYRKAPGIRSFDKFMNKPITRTKSPKVASQPSPSQPPGKPAPTSPPKPPTPPKAASQKPSAPTTGKNGSYIERGKFVPTTPPPRVPGKKYNPKDYPAPDIYKPVGKTPDGMKRKAGQPHKSPKDPDVDPNGTRMAGLNDYQLKPSTPPAKPAPKNDPDGSRIASAKDYQGLPPSTPSPPPKKDSFWDDMSDGASGQLFGIANTTAGRATEHNTEDVTNLAADKFVDLFDSRSEEEKKPKSDIQEEVPTVWTEDGKWEEDI